MESLHFQLAPHFSKFSICAFTFVTSDLSYTFTTTRVICLSKSVHFSRHDSCHNMLILNACSKLLNTFQSPSSASSTYSSLNQLSRCLFLLAAYIFSISVCATYVASIISSDTLFVFIVCVSINKT